MRRILHVHVHAFAEEDCNCAQAMQLTGIFSLGLLLCALLAWPVEAGSHRSRNAAGHRGSYANGERTASNAAAQYMMKLYEKGAHVGDMSKIMCFVDTGELYKCSSNY